MLREALTDRTVVLEDLPPAGLAYLLACEDLDRSILIVAPDDDRAEQLTRDLRAFGVHDTQLFVAESHVPFDAAAPDPDITFTQLAVRHRIVSGDRPPVIVVPATAVQMRWPPQQSFVASTLCWRAGTEIPQEEIAGYLLRCGYNRVPFVEDPGTFAIRGSIVDIFSPGQPRPQRLDFFGDELETIKAFDPETQRTYAPEDEVVLHPIREVVFDDASITRAQACVDSLAEHVAIPTRRMRELSDEIGQRNYFYGVEALWPLFYEGGESVLDTLIGEDTLVVLDDASEIEAVLASRYAHAEGEYERAIERGTLTAGVSELMESAKVVEARLRERPGLRTARLVDDRSLETLPVRLEPWTELRRELEMRRKDATRGEILDPVVEEIRARIDRGHEVFITCSSRGNAERLRELLIGRELDLPVHDALPPASGFGKPRRHPRLAIAVASLTAGFADDSRDVALLTDVEIFGTPPRRIRRRKRRPAPEGLTTLRHLRDGDLVIHVDHGIGRYLGLKRLTLEGVDGDYVHLEYAGGDKLYLPIYRLSLLQRYSSTEARLDKLGGTRWERTKQRVRDTVLAVAHSLLAIQARRKSQPGFAMAEPDDHFRAFEATFIHEETEDQLEAINDVLADMTKPEPMDRLICGDVGFGKTEVAVRAAFLAVLNHKQVAVLVPTTVLAEQHGITFRERLAGEPINVEVLSRFRTAKESRRIIAELAEGKIDILVGTHRMLSSDVTFKELGLLVVDEEQRFGVKNKERIKELRSQVHVLTLSATPIPRTMHMAMLGLRDLSIISTPPTERTSIHTEVTLFDEELLQEAIRRELHRGGQVFVVHNRVQSIQQVADTIAEYVPEAKIAIAHGQMTGPQLEKIMVQFVRRDFNVLVCTAIIESGIDIPTANTMIINRADTFGLAQLHQLRGRIGRGRDRAYAYLLLPRAQRITREASERLAVLKRFSDLGAGFHIATHDLDIRGAGNLLGSEQHGSMAAVGLELYTELLAEAVEIAKGQRVRGDYEPEIKLSVAAVLPETYVQDPVRRLEYYQRMANADSDEGVFDICSEIQEVYGKAPEEVYNLGEVMVIRRRLKALGATSLSAAVRDEQIKIGLAFLPDAPVDHRHVAERIAAEPERYRLLPSGRLMITVPTLAETEPLAFLQRVRGELGHLKVLG